MYKSIDSLNVYFELLNALSQAVRAFHIFALIIFNSVSKISQKILITCTKVELTVIILLLYRSLHLIALTTCTSGDLGEK